MRKTLLVGAGVIGKAYLKILLELGEQFTVITRGEEKANVLQQDYPDVDIRFGGVESLNDISDYTHAVIATQIDYLADITLNLLDCGIKHIFVEKPLSYQSDIVGSISTKAESLDSKVYVAFNRRNYRSVDKALSLINQDGGISSVKFDFTEAIFRIDESKFSSSSQYYWGIANSSHVIDTVFYLAGYPKKMNVHKSGSGVSWHESGSIFMGHGITEKDIPFSYHADWGCPGRWSIEIQTSQRKLIFSPMEKLQEQKAGTFAISEVDAEYYIDKDYKPGFYHQLKSFLEEDDKSLMTVAELSRALPVYYEIFGYK